MASAILLTLTLTLILGATSVSGITECNAQGLCACKFDDGSMLDLTSLGNTDNTPRFKDVLSEKEGNYYSYNPCKGFTERVCEDASVCISNPAMTESIQIGDAEKAQFKYDQPSGNVVAAYSSGTVGRLLWPLNHFPVEKLRNTPPPWLSEVLLVCDKTATTPTMTAQGQQEGGFFQMTLTSVCACPGGCTASGPSGGSSGSAGSDGGLSMGSILTIMFFVVIIVYVGIGLVTMKFVKKKEGIEIIPNVLFWRTLPILIKGGVMFTLGLCIPRFRQQSYVSK